MRPTSRCYTVIENAGYIGECDVRTAFSTAGAAWRWAERHYGKRQLEELHVQVARDSRDGRTYEY